MAVFVDTSAIYARLDDKDKRQGVAQDVWVELLQRREVLVTSNYVLVECLALVQRRLGIQAVRALGTDLLPVLETHWVEPALHERAMAALIAAGSRRLSLVDCASFEVMRQLGLDTAFALDSDFADQGFRCIP